MKESEKCRRRREASKRGGRQGKWKEDGELNENREKEGGMRNFV